MNRPTTRTQSVQRAIGLLKLIAARHPGGMRLLDLAQDSGIERPTAHRLLASLIDEGLVQQRESDRRYILGDYCAQLAQHLAAPADVKDWFHPLLLRISLQLGDATFLVVPSGFETLCVTRAIGTYPIQALAIDIGNRQPIGVGSGGLAILAQMPEPQARQLVQANTWRLHHYGGLSEAALLELIAQSRERGYAVIGNYAVPGVIGIGVVLRDANERIIAGLSIASIESRMQLQRQREVAATMLNLVRQYHLERPYCGREGEDRSQ